MSKPIFWFLKVVELTAYMAIIAAVNPANWGTWTLCVLGPILINLCGYIEGRGWPWDQGCNGGAHGGKGVSQAPEAERLEPIENGVRFPAHLHAPSDTERLRWLGELCSMEERNTPGDDARADRLSEVMRDFFLRAQEGGADPLEALRCGIDEAMKL